MMRMVAPMEVGICCADLDNLVDFYVDRLGFTRVNIVEVPAEKASRSGLSSAGYRVARIQTPWGERIKLLEPATAPAEPPLDTDILARRNTAYLTFIVDDLQGMLNRLKTLGVPVLSGEEPVEVRPGTFLVFARDPEGNVLEFVEYEDIGAYRPDIAGGGA